MQTKVLVANEQNIQLCARAIMAGELVAFPTETVYGLGANALLSQSVSRIYLAKGRPSDNPLIVHLGDKQKICDYAFVSEQARRLIDQLMPGAITLLLNKKPCIPDVVTAGRQTVGLRVPDSKVARDFLTACDVPVCAPSANTSSLPSPTTAGHVFDDLCGKIEYILDGGSCDIGIESTIVDMSGERAVILRRGGVSVEAIEKVLGYPVEIADSSEEALCPGLKYKHYSPKASVCVVKNRPNSQQIICDLLEKEREQGRKTVVLCYNDNLSKYPQGTAVALAEDSSQYAQNFYAYLRLMDSQGMDSIICEAPKEIKAEYRINQTTDTKKTCVTEYVNDENAQEKKTNEASKTQDAANKGIAAALFNRMLKASGGNII